MDVKQKLKNLSDTINSLETTKALIKTKKEEFAKSIEGLISEQKVYEENIILLKTDLGDDAIKHFNATKEKSFEGGIKVQESKVITYDQKKAFDWCLDKKLFLQLDKKGFEKAYTSLGVDFVEVKLIPKATFPKVIKLED